MINDKKDNISFGSNFKVIIPRDIYRKIMFWVDKSQSEVSGLGNVVFDEEKRIFTISEAILVEQENTSATTDLDAEAVSKAMFHLKDAEGDLKWWWHSHVQMSVFWSGTDTKTIEELSQHGWFLATVFNQKRELRSAMETTVDFMGVNQKVFVDQIETAIPEVVNPAEIAEWDASYKANVREKKIVPFHQSSFNSQLDFGKCDATGMPLWTPYMNDECVYNFNWVYIPGHSSKRKNKHSRGNVHNYVQGFWKQIVEVDKDDMEIIQKSFKDLTFYSELYWAKDWDFEGTQDEMVEHQMNIEELQRDFIKEQGVITNMAGLVLCEMY